MKSFEYRLDALYEPELLSDDEEYAIHQAGAFPSEEEAQKVLDIWTSEGRNEPMAINIVTVYETAEEWLSDR